MDIYQRYFKEKLVRIDSLYPDLTEKQLMTALQYYDTRLTLQTARGYQALAIYDNNLYFKCIRITNQYQYILAYDTPGSFGDIAYDPIKDVIIKHTCHGSVAIYKFNDKNNTINPFAFYI